MSARIRQAMVPSAEPATVTVVVQAPTAPTPSTTVPKATPPTETSTYTNMLPIPTGFEVFPAIGTKHGVTAHGTSLNDNPGTATWNHGLTYTCTNKSVRIEYLGAIEYNGSVIRMNDYMWDYGSLNDQGIAYLDLSKVTDGFKSRITAIIVHTADEQPDVHHDDQVVNVMPDMYNTDSRIKFHTLDFADGGFIDSFTICEK
jgi:hypothetical protein